MDIDLSRLLKRGDYIAIDAGRLVIVPASGKPIPSDWLANHENNIIKQIIIKTNSNAYKFVSFNTGFYGKHKQAGLNLQYENIRTGELTPITFNTELTRTRDNTHGKKGEKLPDKQFRVSKRHKFYMFWVYLGLALPTRLSLFWKRMGYLKTVLIDLSANGDNNLDKAKPPIVNIPYQTIKHIFIGNKNVTGMEQISYKDGTRVWNKQSLQGQQKQGLQVNSSTGAKKYGNTDTRKCGYKETKEQDIPFDDSHLDVNYLKGTASKEEADRVIAAIKNAQPKNQFKH